MAVFGNVRVYISNSELSRPPKGTSLPGTTSSDVFCVKISLGKKKGSPQNTAKSRIWGEENPEPIAIKFCMSSDVNELIAHDNFGEDRLRVLAWRGSNFGLFHGLASSPLQHSRTTARVCNM